MKSLFLSLSVSLLAFSAAAQSPHFVCTDTFENNDQRAKIILEADALDASTLQNVKIRYDAENVRMTRSSVKLAYSVLSGIELMASGMSASEYQVTAIDSAKSVRSDLGVGMTFGSKWSVTSHHGLAAYFVGELNVASDELGGGYPVFRPNLHCRFSTK